MEIDVMPPYFSSSDKDGNKLLNREEYYMFEEELYIRNIEKFTEYFFWNENELARWYDATNSLTPEEEGISHADLSRRAHICGMIFHELFEEEILKKWGGDQYHIDNPMENDEDFIYTNELLYKDLVGHFIECETEEDCPEDFSDDDRDGRGRGRDDSDDDRDGRGRDRDDDNHDRRERDGEHHGGGPGRRRLQRGGRGGKGRDDSSDDDSDDGGRRGRGRGDDNRRNGGSKCLEVSITGVNEFTDEDYTYESNFCMMPSTSGCTDHDAQFGTHTLSEEDKFTLTL